MAISRTGSSLSTGSFMNAAGGPTALPRNSSYNSFNPTWFDRTGDVYYSNEPKDKRVRASRHHSYQDSGIGPSIGPSPLASHVQSEGKLFAQPKEIGMNFSTRQSTNRYTEPSPVNSSGNSTTSSTDHLPEMAPAASNRPQPLTFAEKDIFQRLHTSTTRKVGEAPIYDSPPVKPTATATATATEVQETKPKKQRWSFLGKRNTIAAS